MPWPMGRRGGQRYSDLISSPKLMQKKPACDQFESRSGELADLSYILSLLYWDQRTQMPPGGLAARSHQIATLETLLHERFTDDGYRIALAEAEKSAPADQASIARSRCRVARRRLSDAEKLPGEFVEDLARAASAAFGVWATARARADFAMFAPHLAMLVDLQRRKAEYLGYQSNPYDALLRIYEPGLNTDSVDALFAPLRTRIPALLRRIGDTSGAVTNCLQGYFDPATQQALARQVVGELGYDFDRGRQDLTIHPFAASMGAGDVRITLRTEDDNLAMALFASIHEAGHAMHSQGVPVKLARTVLADCESLVICESQSRLWENMVGRSRNYSDRLLGSLREFFPDQFARVDADQLYRDSNQVQAGYIRVESDEVHYNLHVILRYQIEQELIGGQLAATDVPDRWAELSQELLGVKPPDDALGCLQDVHWSQAAMGYFPTYTLGNLLAAQLYGAALTQRPSIAREVESGNFAGLLDWMRTHVHNHGSKWNAFELVDAELGQQLTAEPFLNYLESKFLAIYPSPVVPKAHSIA